MTQPSTTRRGALAALGAGLALACGGAAAQPAWPDKPLRLVVAFAPGGGTDKVARVIAQKLGERLGQQVVVENRPGGNGVIGGGFVAKAPADGYTLMLVSRTHVITPLLIPAPYDPVRHFTPIALVGSTEFVLVASAGLRAGSIRELVAQAKAEPGTLNYASSGNGSSGHLGMELFGYMTGSKMQHVPYKGVALAFTDLMAGQVQLSLVSPVTALPHIQSGRVKALAVTGRARFPSLPAVPTFDEAGLADFNANTWFGVLAPPGLPPRIVERLNRELAAVMLTADMKEKLASEQVEPASSSAKELADLMAADSAKFGQVIKAANIRIE